MLFVNHYSWCQSKRMPRPRAPSPVNSSDMEAVIVARRLPNPVSQGRHSFSLGLYPGWGGGGT